VNGVPVRLWWPPTLAKGDSFAVEKPQAWSDETLPYLGGTYPYDRAPDGKRFAVVLNAGGAGEQQTSIDSVTVLLYFFDELRRRVPVGKKLRMCEIVKEGQTHPRLLQQGFSLDDLRKGPRLGAKKGKEKRKQKFNGKKT
jgi:hypothetical protein